MLLESTPVFVDSDAGRVHADGSRIGLGTFELRPGELVFEPTVPPDVQEAIVAGFARDHWMRMLDEPDPRFGGLTPREAARTSEQRPHVARWLRTLENSAAHGCSPDGAGPDVVTMCAELAMPDEAVASGA